MITLRSSKSTKAKKTAIKPVYVLYALLVVSAVLYIITGISLLGAVAFVLVVVILAVEFGSSIKSAGVKKTLLDVGISVAAAVLLFLVLPSILLHTSSPVDVVVSCSMLPTLHRGDIVILHGVGSMQAFLSKHKIPVINVSSAAFNSMLKNMQSEFLEPYAYANHNASEIVPYAESLSGYGLGYYSVPCLYMYSRAGEPDNYYRCIVPESAQQNNLITYSYSIGKEQIPGSIVEAVYTSSINISGIAITENYSNPIIVYRAAPNDYFSGDIIHRLYAAINVNGAYYLLTKGDNNPLLDIEAMNYPVSQNAVVGYVVSDIPVLGYPSLIVRGQIGSVSGCNQTLLH